MAKLTFNQKLILAAISGRGGNGSPGSEPDPPLDPVFRLRITMDGSIRQTTNLKDRETAQ